MQTYQTYPMCRLLIRGTPAAGQNGQFRTPRHIIRLMVERVEPKPTDIVCDPACGTCGFLVVVGESLRERHPEAMTNAELRQHFHRDLFHGFDFDNTENFLACSGFEGEPDAEQEAEIPLRFRLCENCYSQPCRCTIPGVAAFDCECDPCTARRGV